MGISEIYDVFKSSNGISTDTRTIQSGQLFLALKGENFDGHDYLERALNSGASKAIIDDPNHSNENTILVDDCLETLQKLARYHRDQMNIPVLGITGSNGKTTTKELIHAVLSKKYIVHATKGNLNNHIGVPLTILSAPDDTELMVVEMGANRLKDIAELCEIADPESGLITNIGQAHLEGFGSYEGVIKTKTELYKHIIERKGDILVNQKDDILLSQLNDYPNIINYPTDIEFELSDLSISFSKANQSFKTSLYGEYNSTNILAAIAVGRKYGVNDEDIFTAISGYAPNMNRSQIIELGTTTLIMDAYNANLSRMAVSISSLEKMTIDKTKTLVLGDMKELGVDEIKLHQEILDKVRQFGTENIFLIGPLFKKAGTNMFLNTL